MLVKKPFKKGFGHSPAPYYAATAAFVPQGVNFSASAFINRGTALTGVTDSKVGTISFWFRGNAGSDSATIRIFNSQSGSPGTGIFVDRLSTGQTRVVTQNAAGTNLMVLVSTSTFFSADGWKNLAAFWDNAAGVAQVYVGGVLESSLAPTNDTIDYATSQTDWALPNSGLPGPFDIAELWFSSAIAFDLSVSSNLQKFISGGNAVNLGTNGGTPTGTSPPVFFSGAVASWNTNKGTGGGFTVNSGPLTASTTNPP